MPVAVPRFGAEECPLLPPVRVEDLEGLVIRPATVRDVHGMSALINQYAAANVMLARGPQYLYQHIQDYMVAVTPAADGKTPVVVACGALHVLWEDLAEIRSLAVHAACQDHGLGRRMVAALVELPRPGPAARVCLYPGGDIFCPLRFQRVPARQAAARGLGGVQQVPEVLLL